MDEYIKKLFDEFVKVSKEVVLYKEREKQLVRVLWDAEIKEARDCEKYKGRYNESIDDTKIRTSTIRDIYGILPCPEALNIYKAVYASKEDPDDED